MTADLRKQFNEVFQQLESMGLLLLSDSTFPNIASIVAKERVKGSWWGHRDSHAIFSVSQMLEDHPDVLVMKLVSGKVTFVHRELWGRVYSIGVAREDWQMKKLSAAGKLLLKRLDADGFLETNRLTKAFGAKPGDTARELEARMLVHSEQIHTESGAHAKVLETWPAWANRTKYKVSAKRPSAARRFLEQRLESINAGCSLPWQTKL
jgi:hypothetical protein